MRLPKIRAPGVAVLLLTLGTSGAASVAGCASILGIKEFSEGADGGPNVKASVPDSGDDVAEPSDTGSNSDDGSTIVPIADAGPADVDLGPEISAPPPPPVSGKAGFGLTAGGSVSTSTHYKLVGAVGESPGAALVSTSTSYTLKGGLVAATQ
jgi:hypothetical protein